MTETAPPMPLKRHRHTAPEVRPARQPTPAVEVDRREDRFEEEEDPLDAERQAEDRAEASHQPWPEQTQLEGEHGSGDRANGDEHPERL